MLSRLKEDYELVLNKRLDNIDYLLEQAVADANKNSGLIKQTLEETAASVKIDITSEMDRLWGSSSPLSASLDVLQGGMTGITDAINLVKDEVNRLYDGAEQWAQQMVQKVDADVGQYENFGMGMGFGGMSGSSGSSSSSKQPAAEMQMFNAIGFVSDKATTTGKNTGLALMSTDGAAITSPKVKSGDVGLVLLDQSDNKFLSLTKLKSKAKGGRVGAGEHYNWTQEHGNSEYIIRKSDGAVLTPVSSGDLVMNSAQSKNMLAWSDMNPYDVLSGMHNNAYNNQSKTSVVNIGNITLPNVMNYEEFKTQLMNDSKFESYAQNITIGRAMGASKLSKNRYK